MLQVEQFDVKTGKPVQVAIEGRWQPAVKQIEHSYLEHWCQTNNIDTQGRFSVAQFYESVHDSDRRQLESEGKYLVFSSDSEGYFTDYETAQLMTLGNETIAPIYAGDVNAAHNSVAYGGLISSDGKASTTLSSARILVIDDENRAHGDTQLVDTNGQTVSIYQLAHLYDKMGDGTMLVAERTMQSLQTSEEKEQIALRNAERSAISGDISTLAQDVAQIDAAADAAAQQEIALARCSVYQFRAASPELPGIAKGTMSSSQWCERLGVDAIISRNDIKGDDNRLSKLGIQEVSNFWINRKATARYGQQTVGPQVKYNIPEATQLEINPKVRARAEQLAQIAGDFDALRQRYLDHKEHETFRPYQDIDAELSSNSRPDWLHSALSSDKYGQLAGQASVVRALGYYVQGEWQRLSSNGTSVPSAMAQHHSKLKSWEVCNKDLPHGAIVAYYRSPFPNVGAAAIAINNTEIIKQQDREAFSKQGGAYLPPDTSKNVAITDFDGDINGFFMGYQATVGDLPEQLREELADVASLPAAHQYEAARSLFEKMIEQHEQAKAVPIEPSTYPVAVKEFVQRTAPDIKPPQIAKQPKEKHAWQKSEPHAEATWRAWGATADNPTGKVANAGMSLQALALELEYAPDTMKERLLCQVSSHFSRLMTKVKKGEVIIPDDDWLVTQGFSPFYAEKIEQLASAGRKLNNYTNPQTRRKVVETSLKQASELLLEVATGPNAVNLQTAVDTAKSAKGIDTDLHGFVRALQYKPDDFRKSRNSSRVYVDGKEMPTSVNETVSWGVQQVNEQYSGAVLKERKHEAFQAVFPKGETPQQRVQADTIIQTTNGLTGQAVESKSRHRQRRAEDQRPTIQVTTADGRQVRFQNVADAQGTFPWRSEGAHPDWKITITKNDRAKSPSKRFPAELRFVDDQGSVRTEPIGYLDQGSVQRFGIEEKFKTSKSLTINAPHLTMQVPWSQENDSKMLYAQREQYLERAFTPPEGTDPQVHSHDMALALWRQSKGGRKLAMQHFPEALNERLQVFSTKLTQVENVAELVCDGPRTVRFTTHDYINTNQEQVERNSVSIAESTGEFRRLGYIANDHQRVLPYGNTFMASFEPVMNKSGLAKQVVRMLVMSLPTIDQTPAERAALEAGRRHLTLDSEPYATYGVRAGDIIIAQSAPGGERIALQVKDQHRIDAKLAALGSERWAEAEKAPSSVLFQQLATAHSAGKELWGVNVQPLGTYERGQIRPFEPAVAVQQPVEPALTPTQERSNAPSGVMAAAISAHDVEPSVPVPQPAQTQQQPSPHAGGVFAAVMRNRPELKQRLEQDSAQPEPNAIAPEEKQNAAPDQQPSKTVSNQQPKQARPRPKPRRQSPARKRKEKGGGIEY